MAAGDLAVDAARGLFRAITGAARTEGEDVVTQGVNAATRRTLAPVVDESGGRGLPSVGKNITHPTEGIMPGNASGVAVRGQPAADARFPPISTNPGIQQLAEANNDATAAWVKLRDASSGSLADRLAVGEAQVKAMEANQAFWTKYANGDPHTAFTSARQLGDAHAAYAHALRAQSWMTADAGALTAAKEAEAAATRAYAVADQNLRNMSPEMQLIFGSEAMSVKRAMDVESLRLARPGDRAMWEGVERDAHAQAKTANTARVAANLYNLTDTEVVDLAEHLGANAVSRGAVSAKMDELLAKAVSNEVDLVARHGFTHASDALLRGSEATLAVARSAVGRNGPRADHLFNAAMDLAARGGHKDLALQIAAEGNVNHIGTGLRLVRLSQELPAEQREAALSVAEAIFVQARNGQPLPEGYVAALAGPAHRATRPEILAARVRDARP